MKLFATISWVNGRIRIIDQTKLPQRFEYLYISEIVCLFKAIKELKVRGAPALGAAGALGVYLGIKDSKVKSFSAFKNELDKVSRYIASSRPTARNLFWGIERINQAALNNLNKPISSIKKVMLQEALKIIAEDRISCRAIGRFGAKLIKNNDAILTICNAGILATIDYGTALGVIYRAKFEGKKLKVYSCETRPLLQGARLTNWELLKNGVDVTLICDNTVGLLMKQGKINKVIVGADRIASNGDAANKIGTLTLAILARHHNIPFYIAAPVSTFDLKIKSGKDIVIEQRPREEIADLFFKNAIVDQEISVYNPAFDVTPEALISGIITDKGVIKRPFTNLVKRLG